MTQGRDCTLLKLSVYGNQIKHGLSVKLTCSVYIIVTLKMSKSFYYPTHAIHYGIAIVS